MTLRDCQCPDSVLRTWRTVTPGGDVYLMAYVEDIAGNPIVPGNVASIIVSVTDVTFRESEGWEPATTAENITPVSSVVFDPPVTDDGRWCTTDPAGYNFGYVLPGSKVPGDRDNATVYEVDVKFTMVDGGIVRHTWELSAAQLLEGTP